MNSVAQDSQDRYIVPALERGLRLLRSFTRDRPSVGLGELAREHGLPRTTVFRIVHTLETLGFLQRDVGAKTFRLGPAVLGLGFEFLSSMELTEIAGPFLEALRDAAGASAHLAIRDGDEIVYVSRYASRSALASNIRVGSRLPAHASSMGRAILADLREEDLERLYGGRMLQTFTPQTPDTLDKLRCVLDGDRANGYVISRSYFERGVVTVAAAVRDFSRGAIAAINVTAAEHTVDEAALIGVFPRLVCETADNISRWLGYNPPGGLDPRPVGIEGKLTSEA